MSSIIGINKDLAMKTGHPINWGQETRMQNVDGSFGSFRGVTEHFPIKIGSIMSLVDAVIAEDTPYDILLGMTFRKSYRCYDLERRFLMIDVVVRNA